jgi:rhodanese-related sulfurtransferase
MERKYTILAILMVVMALGLLILPKKERRSETEPGVLLAAIAETSRYLSVDQVTRRIIENDPSLLLIDLRSAEQFKTFALPGAIHLQSDSLFTNAGIELLNQPGKDKVLLSNSDLLPEKIWLICSRNSIKRVFILKGGMNEWFNTIIRPNSPVETPSSSDLNLISFRSAARQYFLGADEISNAPVVPIKKEKTILIRKAPAASTGGGC